jgi:hypothetical protein
MRWRPGMGGAVSAVVAPPSRILSRGRDARIETAAGVGPRRDPATSVAKAVSGPAFLRRPVQGKAVLRDVISGGIIIPYCVAFASTRRFSF